MRRVASRLFVLILLSGPLSAQHTECSPPPKQQGCGAGYSTRDATILSMMGWGLGLGVGIALLCTLIEDSTATTHSH